MFGETVMAALGGMENEAIHGLSRTRSSVLRVETWVTVEEFVDGDDSADCNPCRRELEPALDRYWSGE